MAARYLKFIGIILLSLSVYTCKKDSDDDDTETGNLFEVYQTLNNTRDKFFEYGEAQNGNYKEAIVLTGAWVETQPGVKNAFYEDSINIFITMESGLKTIYSVQETDAQGHTLYRGGGGGNTINKIAPTGNCTNKIDNKKVLIFAAAYDDFYQFDNASLQRVIDLFEDTNSEFEVTVLKNKQCTPDIVETFGNYGFVSLETHGSPESFQSGVTLDIPSPEDINSAQELTSYINSSLGAQYGQWFADGKVVLGDKYQIDPLNADWWQDGDLNNSYTISISSLYIESLPPTPNTIILGNMCFSGYGAQSSCLSQGRIVFDKPIRKAFETLNPISYYCYAFTNETSTTVGDDDAKRMLWELTQSFLNDGDSTGNAYLTDAGTLREATVATSILVTQCQSGMFFKHFGKADYCYGGCGDTIIDSRDGQMYETVCIGDQVWMAENLNWAGAGSCASGSNANCNTYGRWYKYDEIRGNDTSSTNPSGIQGVCPQGWHLPSMAEWQQLFDFLGTDAGGKLKALNGWAAPNVGATNSTGFGALGGGYLFNGTWEGKDELAYFGTSTMTTLAGEPYFRVALIYNSTSDAYASTLGGSTLPTDDIRVNCRCVKD